MLVIDENPTETTTSAEFELVGGMLQLDVLAYCCDIQERTTLNKNDNLNIMIWECKGSYTTYSYPARLLRSFGTYQRYHRRMQRHDH